MAAFLLGRLAQLLPVLLGLSVVVFLIMALVPGDPAVAILGPYATPERVRGLEESLELDAPLPIRYATWLGNVLNGELGWSYSEDRAVEEVVLERLGPTLLLAAAALLVAALVGLLAGVLAAVRRDMWSGRIMGFLCLLGISTPAFWLAMLLVLILAVWWGAFPVSGMMAATGSRAGSPVDLLHHLALPAVSLGLIAAGVVARFTRANMLEVLRQDFVMHARARGLTEGEVLYRHAFRSCLARTMPVIGLQAGFVLGGAVYIETVFQWPGLGRTLVEAISQRDLLLVQGGVLLVAACYVLINLLTDLAQHALDPRSRP